MSSLLHRFFSSYSANVSRCCGFSCFEAWALGCSGFSSCGLQTDSSPLSHQGSPKAAPSLWNTHSSRPWDFPGKSTGVGCHCLLRSSLAAFLPSPLPDGEGVFISHFSVLSHLLPEALIYSPIPYHCHHHHHHHPGDALG